MFRSPRLKMRHRKLLLHRRGTGNYHHEKKKGAKRNRNHIRVYSLHDKHPRRILFLGYLKCFGSASWPQIMDYFRDGFTDFRPSIFPVMALRLTKKGLLTATKEGHSFYYDMTPSGQIYYKELVSQYHKFAGGFDHCLAVLEAEQKKAERTVPYL